MAGTPPGFRRVESGPVVLVTDPRLLRDARTLGLLEPGGLARLLAGGGGAVGRAATATLSLPECGERIVLRGLQHGGALGPLLGDTIAGLARPLGELRTTAELRSAGAPVPRPALVVAERRRSFGWRVAVGTRLEPDAGDALAFVASDPGWTRLLRAARAAGRAVRAFHDAGGCHRDLHVKNLLIRERGDHCEAVVIDLDGARCLVRVSPRRRMAELMRLERSLHKRGVAPRVGPRGTAAFFGSYLKGDRRLRRALLAHRRRERLRTRMHALRYPSHG